MRQPWRRWTARQLVVFLFDTVILAAVIVWFGDNDAWPPAVRKATVVIGAVILLTGALVALNLKLRSRQAPRP
jgi:peptidoglycan/LPS O-acetylase OafA/YrhL